LLLLKKLEKFVLLLESRSVIVSLRKALGQLLENIATGGTQPETVQII